MVVHVQRVAAGADLHHVVARRLKTGDEVYRNLRPRRDVYRLLLGAAAVDPQLDLPAGYSMSWSGQSKRGNRIRCYCPWTRGWKPGLWLNSVAKTK